MHFMYKYRYDAFDVTVLFTTNYRINHLLTPYRCLCLLNLHYLSFLYAQLFFINQGQDGFHYTSLALLCSDERKFSSDDEQNFHCAHNFYYINHSLSASEGLIVEMNDLMSVRYSASGITGCILRN